MPEIFISYSSRDAAFVQLLAKYLDDIGFDTWLDKGELEGGDNFVDEIQSAIDESHIFLLMLTPASLESEWVKREYTRAMTLKKRIIPIYLEDCTAPFGLDSLEYIDFRKTPIYPELTRLVDVLTSSINEATEPVGTGVPTRQPDRTLATTLIRFYEIATKLGQQVDPIDIVKYLAEQGYLDKRDARRLYLKIDSHEDHLRTRKLKDILKK